MKVRERHILLLIVLILFIGIGASINAQNHPTLAITKKGVEAIRNEMGNIPLLDGSIEKMTKDVNDQMTKGIQVPIPKDLAGGYSHEQHKRNFFTLQKAGILYQVTKDEKYATYVRDVLLKYMELFPKIDRHPATRSYARGKFFWQCLNDANWLVYMSQAYDCIYDWVDKKTRKKLNENLFKPHADFLSIETPQFFNRIHNHSTWGNAAVGMIGLVMDDDELIKRALYGLSGKVSNQLKVDNDGGQIKLKESGFFAQIDHSFSPDGYYTEGPYYQRYAMYPFLIFAQALENSRPDIKIFDYKDGVLNKAVYAILNQTNSAGEFFPINDAQKGMSYFSRELILATNIAYHFGSQDASLLDIIQQQGIVSVSDAGLSSAVAINKGLSKKFTKSSIQLSDGADGSEGAIGILRSSSSEKDFCLVMKYAKHGMGHGHFDKLSISYYNDAREVYQDYGAARWVNIEQKDGGGYLKENKTWAKQTIAHNTVVVNQTSHFGGNTKKADPYHCSPYIFGKNQSGVQVASAKESNAYDGVDLHRTAVMIEDDAFTNPVLLDIFRVTSMGNNSYDLPFYFQGELMQTNFEVKQPKTFSSLSDKHGYQHLILEAQGKINTSNAVINWFDQNQFYTLITTVNENDQLLFGRIGAEDPLFNLRRDPVFIVRKNNTSNTMYASITEAHGRYSPVDEIAANAYGMVKSLTTLRNDDSYSIVQIDTKTDQRMVFAMANNNNSKEMHHRVEVDNKVYEWTGAFQLFQ